MNFRPVKRNIHGFSLVELMIVVLLTGIAVIAIYRGYVAISLSTDTQEQVIEMHQNLRIGMYWLEKDLRRAGMEEEEDDQIAGFTIASADSLEFTMDLGGITQGAYDDIKPCTGNTEGDSDVLDSCEKISYARIANGLFRNDVNEADGNEVITNVDALNFVYLSEDREEGDEPVEDPSDRFMDDLDPDATPDDPTTGRTPLDTEEMALIRVVQVAMVVRTTNEDVRYTNNEAYRNLQDSNGDGLNDIIYIAPGDHFRRRLVVKEIKIRNAGL